VRACSKHAIGYLHAARVSDECALVVHIALPYLPSPMKHRWPIQVVAMAFQFNVGANKLTGNCAAFLFQSNVLRRAHSEWHVPSNSTEDCQLDCSLRLPRTCGDDHRSLHNAARKYLFCALDAKLAMSFVQYLAAAAHTENNCILERTSLVVAADSASSQGF